MKQFVLSLFIVFSFHTLAQFEDNYDTVFIFGKKGRITKNAAELFGVVDNKGNTVVPYYYNKIIENKLGLFVFKINKSTSVERTYSLGYYNHNFKLILPCQYRSLLAVDKQYIIASQNSDQKFGLVDTVGNIIVDFNYEEMYAPTEGVFLTKLNGNYGFINKKGHDVIEHKYTYASPFSEELAVASSNQLFGYINHRGNFVIAERFHAADDFHYGFAQVYLNDNATVIDKIGTILFPAYFQNIESVGNNQFVFEAKETLRNSLENLIQQSKKGKELSLYQIDSMNYNIVSDNFDENIPHFKGVINLEGKLIGGNRFNNVIPLFSGEGKQIYAVQAMEDRENENSTFNFALMNEKGELISGFDYFEVQAEDKQVLKEVENEIEVYKITDTGELILKGKLN